METQQTQERKRDRVKQMFDDIAPTYDSLNHILSFSIDRLWRRRTVRIVRRLGAKRILDMATGTGDLAIALARRIEGSTICGADLSPEMLEVARVKVERQGLDERILLAECDAEHVDMASESVDAVTVAFGVRNFENTELCLRELHRTIRPGGHIVILEFSNPQNRLVGWFYRIYSHRILPFIGGLISHNRGAYEYLPASVDTFPAPAEFRKMLEGVGFTEVTSRSQSFGIAQIYVGKKV
ncbi:MAG: bifunctional demethylmenaquinone methyltransferase/2-methoxy-6-polyprenyl-1,4-benzoquinol methylase UbiE [Alistipes sp.]|nr:bifunctional demethylmenaquinone methyltransferase/2-methoxy-6-polyprenyl-1,4-benzoquinol methylase UbiE [Alistipes sp.]